MERAGVGLPKGGSWSEDPWIGRVLEGGLRIESLIGEGSAGKVYRGQGSIEPVALKVFNTAPEPRLLEVAGALVHASHPNLTRILGYGSTGEAPFLVMELLEGPTLESLLAEGALPLGEAIGIAQGIAGGMGALHEMGWVHRDLKPHNVILSDGAIPKVLDFGLSLPVGEGAGAGIFEGSWDYVAPEQARGEPADLRSDVYSLGVVLYEMVLGRVPFGDSPITAVLGHLHENPRRPRMVDPKVPISLEAVILLALEKDPEKRFSSMADFASALEACADEVARERPEPRRIPWSAIGFVAAFAAGMSYFLC